MPWKECHAVDERLQFVAGCWTERRWRHATAVGRSYEVPFRKCAARPRLQISFKFNGARTVGELESDDQLPWPTAGSVNRPAGIVDFDPARDIRRESDVVTLAVDRAAENVDEAWRRTHSAHAGANMSPRNCGRNFRRSRSVSVLYAVAATSRRRIRFGF